VLTTATWIGSAACVCVSPVAVGWRGGTTAAVRSEQPQGPVEQPGSQLGLGVARVRHPRLTPVQVQAGGPY
jgi:hypothetical protein